MVMMVMTQIMLLLLLLIVNIILYVTFHHKMSRNVPHGHFHVFIFSESKFYAIYNGENHFQIRGLVAELHVFDMLVRHSALLRKLALNVEDFYVKTIGWF